MGDTGGVGEVVDDRLGEGLCDPLPVSLPLSRADLDGEGEAVGHWDVLYVKVPEEEKVPKSVGVIAAVLE